jgi:hypothetical protein
MEPLYLYETYSMLSNKRRQIIDPNDKSSKLSNKELKFGAYLMLDGYATKFACGKLVDRSPGGDTFENPDIKISSSGLKSIKEGDLLILSKIEILEGCGNDIKPKMTAQWLKEGVN